MIQIVIGIIIAFNEQTGEAEQAGSAKYQFNSHQCRNQRYRNHRRGAKEYPCDDDIQHTNNEL